MPKQTSSLQIRNLERTILELNVAYDYTIEAWTGRSTCWTRSRRGTPVV